MNFFACSLCYGQREFNSFSKYFRHITVFHQNDSKFTITCNLSQTCGALYRTFSGYKSHIYRYHKDVLHSTYQQSSNIHSHIHDIQQDEIEQNIEPNCTTDSNDDSFDSEEENDLNFNMVDVILQENNHRDDENEITMNTIIKSFVLFVLQLREDFLLPKTTMNTITTYIITLIESLQILLRRKAGLSSMNGSSLNSTTSIVCDEMISLKTIEEIVSDVCRQLQCITKSEYRFTQHCCELLGYVPPVEITLSNGNAAGEKSETAYFIPIEQTLLRMLNNDNFVSRILQQINREKKSTLLNDDLMFSFRDGDFGARIDDYSLLIQLYIDDIGVTNPIGAKKDSNKLTMIYFSLEDIPEQYRSKLDFIQLLGICNSKVLKVK